jgi:fructose/tagatose bisphosphate aldolase
MIDGSDKDVYENISFTNQIALKCKKVNKSILIEAEIGQLAHHAIGTNITQKTNINDFKLFAREVIADMLSVSVGNVHGFQTEKPPLDKSLIREINALTKVPLVLHGGDWVSHQEISFLFQHGFRKINVGPEIRLAIGHKIKEYVNSSLFDCTDYRLLIKEMEKTAAQIMNKKFKIQ